MDHTIDVMKVYAFLDEFAEKNPAFTEAVNLVKDKCVDKELPESHPCPAKFLARCIIPTLAFVSILLPLSLSRHTY